MSVRHVASGLAELLILVKSWDSKDVVPAELLNRILTGRMTPVRKSAVRG